MNELKNKITEKEYDNDFSRKFLDSEHIFQEIYKVCGNKMEYGCGSYLIGSKKMNIQSIFMINRNYFMIKKNTQFRKKY